MKTEYPKNEEGMTLRPILPTDKVTGGGCGAYPWTRVEHPDGTIENVRDIEAERVREQEVRNENVRRHDLRTALKTRIVTDAELADVLSLGVNLIRADFTGFQVVRRSVNEKNAEFLFLLNTQAAIRKIRNPALT